MRRSPSYRPPLVTSTNSTPTRAIEWRLGTIGFAYQDWHDAFYAKGVSGPRRLPVYATQFDTVEIDSTFYAIPTTKTAERWIRVAPEGFRFCLKTPRDITHGTDAGHLLRPQSCAHMRQFLEIASVLEDHLSTILIQFPATFKADRHDELVAFLAALPNTFRYAVELRHDSWWRPKTAALFRELSVCWVATDEVKKHEAGVPPGRYRPRPIVPTTDYLYIRWIGWHEQFPDAVSEHIDPSGRLRWWHDRLAAVIDKRPELNSVIGFFGNGYAGHAPATSRRFMHMVGCTTSQDRVDTPHDLPLWDV